MKNLRRFISLLSAFCLVISLVPVQVFAQEEELEFVSLEWSGEEDYTSDELYEAYAASQFYDDTSLLGSAAGQRLSGNEKIIYDAVVPYLRQIANGERASASITMGRSVTVNGIYYPVDLEVVFGDGKLSESMIARVMNALLADLPYECYWFEKTEGLYSSAIQGTKMAQLTLKFHVGDNYQGSDKYTVNTEKSGKAKTAAANAKEIVAKYTTLNDYEKFLNYKDEICGLVSYDRNAASNNMFDTDIDPWQLISVFDCDSSTNVVCEGYSKAFMYLCDLTSFTNDVSAYTVTGQMNMGGHMWNIVQIEGQNYLADVTNSDSGTIGHDGKLFLCGAQGTPSEGYTTSGISYIYDNSTQIVWGTEEDSILWLESENYDPHVHEFNADNSCACGAVGGICSTGILWILDTKTGEMVISGTGEMGDYVNSNSAPWYPYQSSIKTVVMEEGVTAIGNFGFSGCGNLTTIRIPESVSSIGISAFSGCSSLTEVTIPDRVTTIESSTFDGCTSLASIFIPDSVTSIGNIAFQNCSSLTSIWIPTKVSSIGLRVFNGCSNLSSISIPESVKNIGMLSFTGCSLTDVYYAGTEAQWSSLGSTLLKTSYLHYGVTDPENHWQIVGQAATCTQEGYQKEFCGCDYVRKEEITAQLDHTVVTDAAVAATCSETGLTEGKHCSGCNKILVPQEVIPLAEHQWEWITDQEPTVHKPGIKHETCSVCHANRNENTGIPVLICSHNGTMTTTPAQAATCTKVGNTPYSHCSACLKYFSDDEGLHEIDENSWIIPSNGHSYGAVVTAPTCEEAGYTTYTCSICENTYIADQKTALGHTSGVLSEVPPTCTETGLSEGKYCTVCNEVLVAQTIVPAKGHSVVIDAAVEASCTATGKTEGSHCSICNTVITAQEDTPKTDHAYENGNCNVCGKVEVPPDHVHVFDEMDLCTCGLRGGICGEYLTWFLDEDTGILTITGTGAMDNYSRNQTAPWYNHREKIQSVILEDGITTIGEYAFCSCHHVLRTTIPDSVASIGGYAFSGCEKLVGVEIPDSVASIGNYAFYDCSKLADVFYGGTKAQWNSFGSNISSASYIHYGITDPVDHWCIDSQESSCSQEGYIREICSCNYVRNEKVLELLPHTEVIDAAVAATCTDSGQTEGKHCSICGDVLITQTIVPAAGHTEVTDAAVAATCTETGKTEGKHCSACGDILIAQTIVPAAGHTEVTDAAVAATCTETGLKEGKHCSVCGEVLIAQTTEPAKGHTEVTDPPVAATCIKSGVTEGKHCAVCHDVLVAQTVVPAKGHTKVIDAAVDATCTTAGKTEGAHCSVCGTVITAQTEIPKSDHEYENGVCTGCGKIQESTDHVHNFGKDALCTCGLRGGTCGNDLTWILDEDTGSLTISGTGAMVDYTSSQTAPWYSYREHIRSATVDEGVSTIGNYSFYGCGQMTEVSIPSTIDTIGLSAFSGCSNLEGITIPDTVSSLGEYAFQGCSMLTSIDVPGNVRTIGTGVFSGCTNLSDVTLSNGLSNIGSTAFQNCSSLTTITIPKGVTSIGMAAFRDCSNLDSVVIPDSIKTFGFMAFSGCGLTDVYYSGTADQWSDLGSTPNATYLHHEVTDPENHWFLDQKDAACGQAGYSREICSCNYERNKTTTEPLAHIAVTDEAVAPTCTKEGLTEGSHCSACGKVLLAQEIIPMLDHDFHEGICKNCGTAESPEEHTHIFGNDNTCACGTMGGAYDENLTWTLDQNGSLMISGTGSMTGLPYNETPWYGNQQDVLSIVVADGVESIIPWAFYNCSNVREITLPDSVTSIGMGAFRSCSSLETINLPEGLTSIESNLFAGCSSLKSITLPEGITVLEESAFNGCASLESITIPASVTTLEKWALSGCQNIAEIVFAGNAPTIAEDAFTWIDAVAYYPEKDGTWTTDRMLNYGGTIAWVPYEKEHVHTEVIDEAKDATCTETGLTEGSHCSTCGEVLVAQKKVPALGHSYDDNVDGICNTCEVNRETVEIRQVTHMFRMYNPNTGEHFYTGSEEEKSNLVAVGWNYEGVGFTFPANTGAPVHRLFQPSTGEHLYTMDEAEKENLMADGWNYEGIAFNSAYDTEAVQHRLHNPNAIVGAYHFTFSEEEMQNLIDAGWDYQGIGWYSCWK